MRICVNSQATDTDKGVSKIKTSRNQNGGYGCFRPLIQHITCAYNDTNLLLTVSKISSMYNVELKYIGIL